MSHAELKEYDVILNDHGNEWDMLAWASGQKVAMIASNCLLTSSRQELPEYLVGSAVMARLMEFTRNSSNEKRLMMPSLGA
jgi:hypothetical protein